MTSTFDARVVRLPDTATARNPLGLRYVVAERAAIMHFDGGLPFDEAEARAWDLEVPGQRSLGGVT